MCERLCSDFVWRRLRQRLRPPASAPYFMPANNNPTLPESLHESKIGLSTNFSPQTSFPRFLVEELVDKARSTQECPNRFVWESQSKCSKRPVALNSST
jgi:hypothetical protein